MGTVVFDGTRIDDAESLTPTNGAWEDTGGKACALEPDIVWQNTRSVSEKVGTSRLGVRYQSNATGGTFDFSTTPQVALYKVVVSNVAVLNNLGTGLDLYMGDYGTIGGAAADYYEYFVEGGDTYPPRGGWLVRPIDPNRVGWRDGVNGTAPTLSALEEWGCFANFSATSKAENVAMDAIDFIGYGEGLTITGTNSNFQDFIDFDEGTSTNRYGVVVTEQGVLVVTGTLNIGTATSVAFSDSFKTLVFPDGRVTAGFFGVGIDLTNASTDVSISSCSFLGRGSAATKKFFDSDLQVVGGATDEITLLGHGFATGDLATYSAEGGTAVGGLTTATDYFVRAVDADTIAVFAVGATVGRQNAVTNTSRISLTPAAAPGENHSFVRVDDTRPDWTVTATTGVQALATDCVLDAFNTITMTSKAEFNGGFIINSGTIAISTGTIDGVEFSGMTTTEGEALIDPATTVANIDNCTFTAGAEGHGVRITGTGTMAFTGNTLSGYWTPAANGWQFHTQTGVEPTTDVITTDAAHGFATGDAVWYEDGGLSDTIGLTDQTKYYVNVITTTTFSVHPTRADAVTDANRIALSDGAAGQTQSFYSGKAFFHNDSGGAVTINVSGGSTPYARNSGASTTTINAGESVIFEAVDGDDVAIQNVRISAYLVSDDTEVINALTNASGIAQTTFSGTTPADIYYRYRKSSTGATKYVNLSGLATIETGTGASVKRNMTVDAIADPAI